MFTIFKYDANKYVVWYFPWWCVITIMFTTHMHNSDKYVLQANKFHHFQQIDDYIDNWIK